MFDISEDVDFLLIAGDLAPATRLEEYRKFFDRICSAYPMVFAVMGNHDYYHSSFEESRKLYAEFLKDFPNFKMLDRSIEEYQGVKVAGATLWFQDTPDSDRYDYMWNDFSIIKQFREHVYQEELADREFLLSAEADIYMTHHLVSSQSVAPRYVGSQTNRFVLNPILDGEGSNRETKNKIWVHGHTHTPCSYQHKNGMVMCNPLGYPHENANYQNLYGEI